MSRIFNNDGGSILIVVLWTLIMIGYLAGDYLVHNRSKAGAALNLMNDFRRENIVESLVHLVATDTWKAGLNSYKSQTWVDISVEGVAVKFRLDDEGSRINVNLADDETVRKAVVDIMAGVDPENADSLADAILDWRDANDLVRVNGAEKNWYEIQGLKNAPANGFFKTVTELLMVKGMTPKIFWGNPETVGKNKSAGDAEDEDESDREESGALNEADSILEGFSVFEGGIKRLSILIPLNTKRAGKTDKETVRLYTVLFLKDLKKREVVERYTEILEG